MRIKILLSLLVVSAAFLGFQNCARINPQSGTSASAINAGTQADLGGGDANSSPLVTGGTGTPPTDPNNSNGNSAGAGGSSPGQTPATDDPDGTVCEKKHYNSTTGFFADQDKSERCRKHCGEHKIEHREQEDQDEKACRDYQIKLCKDKPHHDGRDDENEDWDRICQRTRKLGVELSSDQILDKYKILIVTSQKMKVIANDEVIVVVAPRGQLMSESVSNNSHRKLRICGAKVKHVEASTGKVVLLNFNDQL